MLPLTPSFPAPSFDNRFFDRRSLGLPIFSVTAIFALRRPQFSSTMEQGTKCCLMFVDQLTPGKLMIRQPLTKCYYSMPNNFPGCLDVPNIHVDEIARFYNLSFHPAANKPPSMWSEYVHKVVIDSDESRAIVLFHSGQVGSTKLTFISSWYATQWSPVYSFRYDDVDAKIDDIVCHRGEVLGVDRVGRLLYVEGKEIIVTKLNGCGTKRKRLVESNGVIYLVVRGNVHQESEGRKWFKVFELVEDLDEWVEVTSFGDMVFFFGLDFSFSISPDKLGSSFRENCIVYVENSFKDYDEGVADDVMLFSNLRFGDLRIGVWHMEDPCHCGTIGSYPGYSNVLWPPPAWLWPIDMSKRIRDLEAALADLLMNVPAKRLKAMSKKQPPPLEQAVIVDDDSSKQDIYEIWRAAHRVQVYLKEAKEILKNLESIKSKNDVSNQQTCESVNFQDQAESSSGGIRLWQGSVNSERNDSVISEEMKLNDILLHLEQTTTKLQKVRLLRRSSRVQKSTRDDAFTYG